MEQSFLENRLMSSQKSSETRLEELEMKETHINNRLKEIESKEKEMGLVQKMLEQREKMVESKEKGFGGISDFDCSLSMDGQKMLMFLNQYVDGQEKLHDVIYNALKLSNDPAKLVLDAVKEFYAENEEMGSSGSVRKRSCLILLEQLTRLGPIIKPAVKAEVATLAREWRAKIKMEDEQNGVLEVMGFLLLLGAYGLVDEFDFFEMLSVFETIGQHHGQADELCTTVDLTNKDPECRVENDYAVTQLLYASELYTFSTDLMLNCLASTVFDSQVKANWSLEEEDKELNNRTALSFKSPSDALKYFCVGMDGKGLRSFLYDHVEEHDSLCNEVQCALIHAPDPAKLVLDAIPGFLQSQPEFDKGLALAKIRKSCILLLEQLMIISPQISPNVREKALAMADEWEANLGQKFQRPVTVYGFLLFLAAYGFSSNYEADELIRLFGIATQYKPSPGLCQVLGLADKVEVIIQSLIQKPLLLEAIDNMYAYQVADKFKPVRVLKGYLNYSKKRIYKKGKGKKLVTEQGIDKEITAMRTVIKYIVKYNLESEFPPEDLEKQIVKLEQQKGIHGTLPTEKQKAYGKASTSADSQVKFEPAPNENLQLDNQMSSLSTGPWPQLDAFCISNDGKGLGFFSYEHTEERDSMSSSSSVPWPELKSFCVNMEGRGLRNFLNDHIKDHDSLCNEVYDALQYAADPAKLVLEAMPGFFRSQHESAKGVSLKKVRKSCILLLEQLITISPEINPQVKEESLKMANEWKANLGEKYLNPIIVYGFLHLVAAYELASNYEADELLGLIAIANQYKVCLNFCQILGLTDKIEVLIKALLQKNLIFEAIEHIYAFEISDKFKPAARLLKGYLIFVKKTVYKKGAKKQAIDKEIGAVRNVMQCIAKYKLESEYPPEELQRQIVDLENQKLMLK